MGAKDTRQVGFDSFLFNQDMGGGTLLDQDPMMQQQDTMGNAAIAATMEPQQAEESLLFAGAGGPLDDPESVGSYSMKGESESEDYEDTGIQGEATGTLYEDGGALAGTSGTQMNSDNGEGMTASGSLSLGGGLEAHAWPEPVEGGRVRIVVLVKANASLGGQTEFAQDDQDGAKTELGGGMGVSGAMSGEWETAEIVDGATAQAFVAAWDAGDSTKALRCMASLAAIVERVLTGESTGRSAAAMKPGERQKAKTSVEGSLCLSAQWAALAVSGSGSDKGTHEYSVEATADGLLKVTVAFDTESVLKADGTLDAGSGVKLTGGVAQTVTAGLTGHFLFADSEGDKADALIAVSSRSGLEKWCGKTGFERRECRDGLSNSGNHGVSVAGLDVGWESASEREDSVAVNASGDMNGTTVKGSQSSSFGVDHEGDRLLGLEDSFGVEAEAADGEMTAKLTDTKTETGFGLGLPSLAAVQGKKWPKAFKEAFVSARTVTKAHKLSDGDLTDILLSRVHMEDAWLGCAEACGPIALDEWKTAGLNIMAATPPPTWAMADPHVAEITVKMQALADYISTGFRAAAVIRNLRERFGQGGEDEQGTVGSVDYYPAGTEHLQEPIEGLRERFAAAQGDLDVYSSSHDLAGGRSFVGLLAVEGEVLVEKVGKATTTDAEWQTFVIEEFQGYLFGLSDQWAALEITLGVSDAETGESEGEMLNQNQESKVASLVTIAEAYQENETGMFASFADGDASEYLNAVSALYERWTGTLEETKSLDATVASSLPEPYWSQAARVYVDIQRGSAAVNEAMFAQAMNPWMQKWEER